MLNRLETTVVTRLVKFANCASLFAIFLEKWSLAQKDRVHLVRQERVTSDVHAVDAISNFGSLTFVFLKRALPSKEKRCRSAIRFSVSNFRSLTFVFLKRPISSLCISKMKTQSKTWEQDIQIILLKCALIPFTLSFSGGLHLVQSVDQSALLKLCL